MKFFVGFRVVGFVCWHLDGPQAGDPVHDKVSMVGVGKGDDDRIVLRVFPQQLCAYSSLLYIYSIVLLLDIMEMRATCTASAGGGIP